MTETTSSDVRAFEPKSFNIFEDSVVADERNREVQACGSNPAVGFVDLLSERVGDALASGA